MWTSVLLQGCVTIQDLICTETVRIMLKLLDPVGSDLRHQHRLRRRSYVKKVVHYLLLGYSCIVLYSPRVQTLDGI